MNTICIKCQSLLNLVFRIQHLLRQLSTMLLSTMLLSMMLLSTMLLSTMLLSVMILATMLPCTMLLCTMLLCTMLLCTMILAGILYSPQEPEEPSGIWRRNSWPVQWRQPPTQWRKQKEASYCKQKTNKQLSKINRYIDN